MKAQKLFSLAVVGLSFASGLFLSSCTVKDTIYLQDVNVRGPVNQPPIHVNDNANGGDVSLNVHASGGNRQLVEGHVDGSGSPNKYATRYMNLSWNLPKSYFGTDVDLTLSRGIALTLGFNYSTLEEESFLGGHAGLGLLFHGEAVSGRFDAGVHWQTLKYDAATVVERQVTSLFSSSSSTDTFYFHDIGNSTLFDYYFSLTLNSKKHDWPLNFFAQIAISKQSLTNFQPSTQVEYGLFETHIIVDTRAKSSATFLMITPGIYVNVGSSTRLLAGVRVAKETEIILGSPDIILMPLLQFDLKL